MEIGVTASLSSLCAGAAAACYVGISAGMGAISNLVNYSMDHYRRWHWQAALVSGAKGAALGAVQTWGIGRITEGRAFGWGDLGRRTLRFTFRGERSW